jgi:hypothetical protein
MKTGGGKALAAEAFVWLTQYVFWTVLLGLVYVVVFLRAAGAVVFRYVGF